MKKLLAIVSAAACVFASTFGLAGCGSGNYSETFAGVLSEDTYVTADAAAEAFLANEIAASDTQTTFVSYEKTKDITDEELAAFDLDVAAEDIQSKEWGEVSYTASVGSTSAVALAAGGETMQVKVGMFQIGGAYRYFVPVAGTGEMISKSYYESVLDPAKYVNCTQQFKMTVKVTVSAQGHKATITVNTTYTVKITDTAAEMKMTMSGSAAGQTMPGETATLFLLKKGDGFAAYINADGYWQQYYNFEGETGISSWDELYEMNLDEFMDYSYFEKTASGFKLAPIKFDQYLENYMEANEELNDTLTKLGFTLSDNFSGEATYFVTEGRLSKASVKLTMKMSQDGATVSASASGVNTFSDFGTTTVQTPAGLPA